MRIVIQNMKTADIELIYSSPDVSGSNRPVGLFDYYNTEQERVKVDDNLVLFFLKERPGK